MAVWVAISLRVNQAMLGWITNSWARAEVDLISRHPWKSTLTIFKTTLSAVLTIMTVKHTFSTKKFKTNSQFLIIKMVQLKVIWKSLTSIWPIKARNTTSRISRSLARSSTRLRGRPGCSSSSRPGPKLRRMIPSSSWQTWNKDKSIRSITEAESLSLRSSREGKSSSETRRTFQSKRRLLIKGMRHSQDCTQPRWSRRSWTLSSLLRKHSSRTTSLRRGSQLLTLTTELASVGRPPWPPRSMILRQEPAWCRPECTLLWQSSMVNKTSLAGPNRRQRSSDPWLRTLSRVPERLMTTGRHSRFKSTTRTSYLQNCDMAIRMWCHCSLMGPKPFLPKTRLFSSVLFRIPPTLWLSLCRKTSRRVS